VEFNRWKIVIAMAMLLAAVFAILWSTQCITEASTRFAIRFTARSSCIAFLLAFVAAPLSRRWQSPTTLWLSQNRRFLGLAMAVSHTYHAIAFTTLQVAILHQPLHGDPLAILGYVFLIGMTITSFSIPTKAIGRKAWRILHTAGMHYFWLAFALEFGMRSLQEWGYLVLTLLIVIALIIRLFDRRKLARLANVDRLSSG
jgi:methionine sulfoxide reductase heme-binding subunit